MLILIFDAGAAFFLAKRIKSIGLTILLAALFGVGNAVLVNMLMYTVASPMFTPQEIIIRIINGSIIHPLVVIFIALIIRSKLKKAQQGGSTSAVDPPS